jgi:polyhydroxybutyrate depolymerase
MRSGVGMKVLSTGVGMLLALAWSGCHLRVAAPGAALAAQSALAGSTDGGNDSDPSLGCFHRLPPKELSGEGERMLMSSGMQRHYIVRLPPGGPPHQPAPLVLNFHGLAESANLQEKVSHMTEDAARRGMVVVYPHGLGWSWNAATCCGRAYHDLVDDVQFVRDMVSSLESEYCIDRKRIYATGMSNGGLLSYRLACEASEVFAAVAPVAASESVEDCKPTRPVSVLAFNGNQDHVIRYDGNLWGLPSVAETISRWEKRDHCEAKPRRVAYQKGEVRCEGPSSCAEGSEVILCTVEGGGHEWPGGGEVFYLGHTTADLDATESILDFFLAHPKPH